MANSFLANLTTSALFATILVEYLLERLPEMGSNVELSNLYLKLFKLVFGSVSLFAAENEQMLKVSVVSYAHESCMKVNCCLFCLLVGYGAYLDYRVGNSQFFLSDCIYWDRSHPQSSDDTVLSNASAPVTALH